MNTLILFIMLLVLLHSCLTRSSFLCDKMILAMIRSSHSLSVSDETFRKTLYDMFQLHFYQFYVALIKRKFSIQHSSKSNTVFGYELDCLFPKLAFLSMRM